MIFNDFHSFSLTFINFFIDFHWFSLICKDFQKFSLRLGRRLPGAGPSLSKWDPTQVAQKSNFHLRIYNKTCIGKSGLDFLEIWYWIPSLILIDFHWFWMIFIDFHWFLMIFIDFQWFSLIFFDFHWFSLIFIDFPWFSFLWPGWPGWPRPLP